MLPKPIRKRLGIQKAAFLRAKTENGQLVLHPVELSPEDELRAIVQATGYPPGPEPKNAMQIVKRAIQRVRRERR